MTITAHGPADLRSAAEPLPEPGSAVARRVVALPRTTPAGVPAHGVLLTALRHVLRTWSAAPDLAVAARGPGAVATTTTSVTGGATFASDAADAAAPGAGGPPAAAVLDWTDSVPAGGDVTLHVAVRPAGAGSVELTWTARPGVLDPALLPGAADALTGLLALLDADPDAWNRTWFDLVPAADHALAAAVNDTAGSVPDVLLHELMAAAAARNPAATAVVDGRRRLTYGELDAYSRRIGRRLRAAGVRPGDLVGIALDKGWEQYAAVYGVLASGAAYLPLDIAAPAERLARLITRGDVRHVLTRDGLADGLTWADGIEKHHVDTAFETPDDEPLAPVQSAGDLAYVIFTSGSTGEPKGVAVDHRGVVNLVHDVNARFGVGAGDRAFSVSALHFDASVYDVFGMIAAGGTVVLPDPATRAQPDLWTERARAEAVTIWNSVPAVLELVVGQAETRSDRPLATVRLAVVSGDWIPLTLPDRLRAQADAVEFVGSGGPTETICWSVFQHVGDVDPRWVSIPYGTPITNQRYIIVDEQLRPRPVGVVGEMAVASDIGLAHGYFADPALTAERFVRLPGTGERAYLTGDLGRRLPDGALEILGRADFQVKIQGYRIELGEIEAALREHPDVESAVVVAPRSPRGGRRLCAFIVGTPGLDGAAARAGAARILPSYMVPATVHVLDALPLTGNGKIDRKALGERAEGRPASVPAAAVVPAPTPVPAGGAALVLAVCRAMAEVLEIDIVGPGENFFRLGGDSVTGARLGAVVNDLLGTTIPLRTLFEHPVPADLVTELLADPGHGATVRDVADLLTEIESGALDSELAALDG